MAIMEEIRERIHDDIALTREPGDLLFVDPTRTLGKRTTLTAMRALRFNEAVGQQRINRPIEYWAGVKTIERFSYRGFFPRTVDAPLSAQTAGGQSEGDARFLGIDGPRNRLCGGVAKVDAEERQPLHPGAERPPSTLQGSSPHEEGGGWSLPFGVQ